MKILNKKILYILILFVFSSFYEASAQNKLQMKKAAIFALKSNTTTDNALTTETVKRMKDVFSKCGRFLPVEIQMSDSTKKTPDERNFYENEAQKINADIYVLVITYQIGNMIFSDTELVSVNPDYKHLEKKFKTRSKINLNIPVKICREITILHKDIPVSAEIIKATGNNIFLINAGEWHGLKNNSTYPSSEGNIRIIRTGRFESLIKITEHKNENDKILIQIYPDTNKILHELDKDISRNTVNRYGLDIQGSPEKRMIEGICCINMGGNICLPGYGAFLSTSYMGFKDTKAYWPGIGLTISSAGMQFILPEILTGFKINFFPWEKDPDKTQNMQNLQKFLWAALPLTFSASYLDQLAYQFTRSEHLPAFFYDRDNSAALFSLFIPGGGLFYKGHGYAGWGFYFSEMTAAGLAVYNSDSSSAKYAWITLGAVKLLDIICAYFIEPSYHFYKIEKEGMINPELKVGVSRIHDSNNIVNLMISSYF